MGEPPSPPERQFQIFENCTINFVIMNQNKIDISDPAYFAQSGTEHGHQVAVFAWAALHVAIEPRLQLLFAIPNGGSRGDSKRSAMIQGATLKAEGVKPGVSDIMLPVPEWGFHGMFIEMKKPGGKESDVQKQWGAAMIQQNYWYECCDSWLKAALLLARYLKLPQAIVTELEHRQAA